MDTSAIGSFLSSNSGTIGNLLGTGAQLYGQQNAGQAISSAATSGIGQAQNYLGDVNALYKPQTTLGNSAMNTLGSTLGLNGQPANYNNFLNMPGYQFAVNQGTQALQRQAAAMGSAYTPNTAAAIGQYVTGTAMQDYNTYINQLQQEAGLGAQANSTLAGANLQTAGNIEQLGMNSGMAQAGMYTGMGQTVGGGTGGIGSTNGSGIGSLIGNGLNLLGNALSGWGGGSGSNANGNYGASTDYGSTSDPFSNSSLFGSNNSLDTNYSSLNPDLGSTDTSNLGNLDLSMTGGSNSSGF